MELQQLVEIAKTYEESLLEQELTKNELVTVLALLTARVNRLLYTSTPQVEKEPEVLIEVSKPIEKPKPVALKKRDIKYDPLYDPPPPYDNTPLPEPAGAPTGKPIAKVNQACICSNCSSVVYMVNKDIPDNCSVTTFIESFTPTQGHTVMNNSLEIQNIDGKISCDCPDCKGNKTLYLVGRK